MYNISKEIRFFKARQALYMDLADLVKVRNYVADRIDYEKEIPKIKDAVLKKGIKYPVVVDNNYQIWSDYLCNTWPRRMASHCYR